VSVAITGAQVCHSQRVTGDARNIEIGSILDLHVMRSLQLFLPFAVPFAAHEREALAALPALSRLLARGRATGLGTEPWEAALLESFGIVRQRDWPLAPLSWLGEGGDRAEGYWLHADPVHLRAERDALVLLDARHFVLEAEAADALVDALSTHFAPDGLRFFAPDPTRWYVRVDRVPDIATWPLRAAAGRSIDALLPYGTEALAWHRRANEAQMLLHGHAVNEMRESAGQPAVNSVWFWGGGVLPGVPGGRLSGVWGDDPLVRGLARAARLSCAALPEHAEHWLARSAAGEHVVVLAPTTAQPREALLAAEELWFAPLLRALKRRQLSALTLVAEDGGTAVRFEVGPADLWKFWRRSPLAME